MDKMSSSITRCPKCSTCFRISEAHLKLAKGSVRCGSCLHVFNASLYIVKTEKAKAIAANSPKHETPVSNHSQPKLSSQEPDSDDEDMLISDDMVTRDVQGDTSKNDTDFNDNILYSRDLGRQESNLFERDILDGKDDDGIQTDESWALDLLESADNDTPEPPTRIRESPENESTDSDFDRSYHSQNQNDYDEALESRTPTGSAFQIIEDDEPDEEEMRQALFGDDGSHSTHEEGPDSQIQYPVNPGERMPPSNNVYLDFEPEPVEMSWKDSHPIWHSKWLWGPLSAAVCLTIFCQIAWIKFDDLSRIEPYRNYYQTVCNTLDCELPKLIDRTQIKAANLVVRSHPITPGALIIDTVIQNIAPFEQQFPAIDLVFTDLNNKPIAARRFSPDEYLGGELAGRKNMPIKQPVHIALEIVDPGEEAVSYRVIIAN